MQHILEKLTEIKINVKMNGSFLSVIKIVLYSIFRKAFLKQFDFREFWL